MAHSCPRRQALGRVRDCAALPCAMPYTRRSTWPDERDDYVIRCEGLDVGRVYLTRVPAGDRWLWTIFMNGHVPQVESVSITD